MRANTRPGQISPSPLAVSLLRQVSSRSSVLTFSHRSELPARDASMKWESQVPVQRLDSPTAGLSHR